MIINHVSLKRLIAENKQLKAELEYLRQRELIGQNLDEYLDQLQIISDLREENDSLKKQLSKASVDLTRE